jgi:hypothetical protein
MKSLTNLLQISESSTTKTQSDLVVHNSHYSYRSFIKHGWLTLLCAVALFVVLPSISTAQRRGGSFGGSRGGSRSYSAPRSSGGSSFGGSRSYSAPRSSGGGFWGNSGSQNRNRTNTNPSSGGSFGSPSYSQRNGNLQRGAQAGAMMNSMNNPQQYTSRYGTPRRTETRPYTGNDGITRNYNYNNYGGYGDGLMMGYMMGHSSWMWSMPFHPAFYYSRPSTYMAPDGSVQVYPPTFSFGTLFFTLLIVGAIGYVIYIVIRSRRRRSEFGSGDMSQSSFG